MGDFIEGEHCFCKFDTPSGEVYWPCCIRKILPNRIAILQVYGTTKLIKTRFEWIEHGYKLSTRQVIDIARKTIPQKETHEVLLDALRQFSDFERLNDIQLKEDVENYWLQETLQII